MALAYLPSLGGGFLNYDDPWLIESNRYFRDGSPSALGTILFDLSYDARMELGAEYLPIRDLSHWLEVRLFGISAQNMRLMQLLFYAGAVLAFRISLLRTFSNRWLAEAAAWSFALHPVHVESVAWLAGRKDVLALLFVGLALQLHTGTNRHRRLLVPALFALACLSKSMAVGAVGIFVALDLASRRKLDRWVYVGLGIAALITLSVHVYVGSVVSMTTEPAGGTRVSAALTMGGIWLEYIELAVWPPALSVSHDVVLRTSLDGAAAVGWFLVFLWGVIGLGSWRKQDPWPIVLWLVFFVPLAPVSQVIFPLENLIADRYLFLSVLSPCLLLGLAVSNLKRAGPLVAAVACLILSIATAQRASTFADSVALFSDATEKTRRTPIAPYQLGQALEATGDDEAALMAYRVALAREPGPSEATRRATNNAAKLLARTQRLDEAERLLVRGRRLWPSDPKILANLARISARQGRSKRACELALELGRRFPNYELNADWARHCAAP